MNLHKSSVATFKHTWSNINVKQTCQKHNSSAGRYAGWSNLSSQGLVDEETRDISKVWLWSVSGRPAGFEKSANWGNAGRWGKGGNSTVGNVGKLSSGRPGNSGSSTLGRDGSSGSGCVGSGRCGIGRSGKLSSRRLRASAKITRPLVVAMAISKNGMTNGA